MENKQSRKLSSKQLIGYALGAIPGGLLAYIFTLKYIELFYDDLKLLPILFIIGQVIYMVINSLNDPLLGQLSDRTNRKKWGSRRIIYIKYGGPIWALTFLLVWFPWSLDNQIIIFIHYIISICLFDTLLTLVVLCWMALLPEMTTDIDERNKANFFVLVFGIIALLPFILIVGPLDTLSLTFQVLMIVIAVISTIFLVIVVIVSEEKKEFQKDEVFPLWKSIKETVKLKSYLLFIGYNFCGVLIGSIGLSYLFVYSLILGPNPGIVTILYFLIYIFVGYGAFIVCMKLQKSWGMRKVILRFGILRVIGLIVVFLFVLIPGLSSLIWLGFIWTTFFGGYGVYTTGGLMYLSVDEDEVVHSTRREGMFLGINALFTKPANSLGPIIATAILGIFGYIQGGAANIQPASAYIGIKLLFFLIPAVFVAISLIFIYFYPFHGEKLKEMQDKLEELHKQKLEKALQNNVKNK